MHACILCCLHVTHICCKFRFMQSKPHAMHARLLKLPGAHLLPEYGCVREAGANPQRRHRSVAKRAVATAAA